MVPARGWQSGVSTIRGNVRGVLGSPHTTPSFSDTRSGTRKAFTTWSSLKLHSVNSAGRQAVKQMTPWLQTLTWTATVFRALTASIRLDCQGLETSHFSHCHFRVNLNHIGEKKSIQVFVTRFVSFQYTGVFQRNAFCCIVVSEMTPSPNLAALFSCGQGTNFNAKAGHCWRHNDCACHVDKVKQIMLLLRNDISSCLLWKRHDRLLRSYFQSTKRCFWNSSHCGTLSWNIQW